MKTILLVICTYVTIVSGNVCWTNKKNFCPDGEDFCQEECTAPHLQCLASYSVNSLGTVKPLSFECTAQENIVCSYPECHPTDNSAGVYSCCCTGDLCNSVLGITPSGDVPTPSGTPPTVPAGHQLCEFYNCSQVVDPLTETCYHGYVACAEESGAETYPEHEDHFCQTIFKKGSSGLFEIYLKGCHYSQLSNCEGVNECVLDTSPQANEFTYCCCDGQLCNVNVTYTHPNNVNGGIEEPLCTHCDHSCDIVNGEATCFCHVGHALSMDMATCIDIDECMVGTNDCYGDEYCSNTDGSFTCTCPEHLKLAEDGRACEETGLVCELYKAPDPSLGLDYCDDDEFDVDPDTQHCSATFQLVDGVLVKALSGCFAGDFSCPDDICYADYLEDQSVVHCCCNGNLCNRNVVFPWSLNVSIVPTATETPLPPVPTKDGTTPSTAVIVVHVSTSVSPTGNNSMIIRNSDHNIVPPNITLVLVVVGAVVILVPLVLVVAYIGYRQYKQRRLQISRPEEAESPPSPLLTPECMDFRSRIGQGRFASVWRVHMGTNRDLVAVKVFSTMQQSRESFEHELDIYFTELKHKNILMFINNFEREKELWIVVAFHSQGSLYDLLKMQTLTLYQFCQLAESAASGLAYLHGEKTVDGVTKKPAIAHRDLKSKNILVKSDGEACISDFGLAVKFGPGESPVSHGQVGTSRYMSPEVLEGAINFQREAFLRIDVYAYALIMWELASRTNTIDNAQAGDYRPPFDQYVSKNPTIEEMKTIVVTQQLRPEIPPSFQVDADLDEIAETISESWDQDPEARLTANCIEERISTFRRSKLGSATSKDSGFADHQHESIDSSSAMPPPPATPSFSSTMSPSPLDAKTMPIASLNTSPRSQSRHGSMFSFPPNNNRRYSHFSSGSHSTETTV